MIFSRDFTFPQMSPHSWATPEQDAFMQEFYTDFVQCQAKRDYSTFWPPFYERWFAKFSERAVTFPEITADAELTEEQNQTLAQAVEARKEVHIKKYTVGCCANIS